METTQRRLKKRLLKQQSSAAQKAAANRKVSALRQKAAAKRKAAMRKAAARKRDAARMRLAQSRSVQNVPSALSVLIARQAKANNQKKILHTAISFFNLSEKTY